LVCWRSRASDGRTPRLPRVRIVLVEVTQPCNRHKSSALKWDEASRCYLHKTVQLGVLVIEDGLFLSALGQGVGLSTLSLAPIFFVS